MIHHDIFIFTLDLYMSPGWFSFGFAFFARPQSHVLHCTIPYLVSSWSVPAHVLRPSSDLAIPPLLCGRLHPFLPLYSLLSLPPGVSHCPLYPTVFGNSHSVWFLSIQLWYLDQTRNFLVLHLTSISTSGSNCLIKAHLLPLMFPSA